VVASKAPERRRSSRVGGQAGGTGGDSDEWPAMTTNLSKARNECAGEGVLARTEV
jgi:hypothetical protein